jgi:hypothetical protein
LHAFLLYDRIGFASLIRQHPFNIMKTINALIIPTVCAVLLAGCASGTYIVTGNERPRLEPEQVTLYYQTRPARFEVVGIVNARGPGTTQHNMNQAVEQLKKEAAKMGANGVILGVVNPGDQSVGISTGTGFGGGTAFSATGVAIATHNIQISGTAIYVYQ